MLVAFLVAQCLGFEIEPLGAEADEVVLRICRRRGLCCFQRGDAPAQHRADARHQFAQFARLCDVIVSTELETDHAVDRARSRGEHDHRHIGAALEIADDRQTVFLGHVEVEHHEIGHLGLDLAAQTLAAVAQRYGEAVHFQIVADHLASGCLVIDDDDMRARAHGWASIAAGSMMVKVAP